MNDDAAFLALYRAKRQEWQLVRSQAERLSIGGGPGGLTGIRTDCPRSTNDPVAARLQLLDGLEEEANRLAAELAPLDRRFADIAGHYPEGSREQLILQLYYRLGQPDAVCAGFLGLSVRHACRLRHRMLAEIG
ncbi:MAG: hypothetical protein ACI4ML_01860 [Aristaeellaceae bacterium]